MSSHGAIRSQMRGWPLLFRGSQMEPNASDEARKARADFDQIVKQNWEHANRYATTVVGLAYGGFFALWSPTRSAIISPTCKPLVSAAGALMTLSLLTFISFEIFRMYVTAKQNNALFEMREYSEMVHSLPDMLRKVQDHHNRAANLTALFNRVWNVILPFTVLTGFAAAAIMFFVFLLNGF